MNLEGLDPAAIGGGLSILATMVVVIRLAFKRLDTQDNAWMELLSAAEKRAIAAETSLTELRKYVSQGLLDVENMKREHIVEIRSLKQELEEAKMQIKELQRWSDER